MAIRKDMYKDFDAMFAEMHTDTIPFKVFGKEYQIRKEIPADLVLEMARMEESDTLSNKTIYRIGLQIFGPEIINELRSNPNFSVEKLNLMIRWAFETINGKADNGSGELTEDDSATEPEKN